MQKKLANKKANTSADGSFIWVIDKCLLLKSKFNSLNVFLYTRFFL